MVFPARSAMWSGRSISTGFLVHASTLPFTVKDRNALLTPSDTCTVTVPLALAGGSASQPRR